MDKIYAKLDSNGELIIAPRHYQDDDIYIMNFNECEELLLQYGYKPVIGKEPDFDHKSQEIEITYAEEQDCIRRIFTIIDIAVPQFLDETLEKEFVSYSVNNIDEELLKKENEELKQRVDELERKQDEMLNILNTFITEMTNNMNKVNDFESEMTNINNSINTFNKFIEFYNSTRK